MRSRCKSQLQLGAGRYVQFIDANGDTLSLTNKATLKYITLANDSFFYDKQYLQLIESNATAKLAKNQKLKLVDVKKLAPLARALQEPMSPLILLLLLIPPDAI